jgi:hypothetical protein
MSLAVAIEGADGIVLAAYSRTTFGDPRVMASVNDNVAPAYEERSPTEATRVRGGAYLPSTTSIDLQEIGTVLLRNKRRNVCYFAFFAVSKIAAISTLDRPNPSILSIFQGFTDCNSRVLSS